jgi:hypothetical protein
MINRMDRTQSGAWLVFLVVMGLIGVTAVSTQVHLHDAYGLQAEGPEPWVDYKGSYKPQESAAYRRGPKPDAFYVSYVSPEDGG